MNKLLGFLWLFLTILYVCDAFEPEPFIILMMFLLLTFYSFTDKK